MIKKLDLQIIVSRLRYRSYIWVLLLGNVLGKTTKANLHASSADPSDQTLEPALF